MRRFSGTSSEPDYNTIIERTLPMREIVTKTGSDGGRGASRSPPPRLKLEESELSRTTTRFSGVSARVPINYKMSEASLPDSELPDQLTSGDEAAEIRILEAKLELVK